MATARTLPMEQEAENMAAAQQPSAPAPARVDGRALNPVLVAILIGMVVFPFLVRVLPTPVTQHLEAIFH
jgi:hypothetical protein